jgi:hypothetical protein
MIPAVWRLARLDKEGTLWEQREQSFYFAGMGTDEGSPLPMT